MKFQGLKLDLLHLFMQDLIFGFLWQLAGFYFEYIVGPGGRVSPGRLMAVDAQFGGQASRMYFGARGSFPL